MAKKELNLLQFAAGGAAEPSATTTEIVRREFVNANLGCELLDDMPDELSVTASPQALPALLTRRKSFPASIPADFVQSSSTPCTQSARDRNGSNVTSSSAQVHDCPMPLALL